MYSVVLCFTSLRIWIPTDKYSKKKRVNNISDVFNLMFCGALNSIKTNTETKTHPCLKTNLTRNRTVKTDRTLSYSKCFNVTHKSTTNTGKLQHLVFCKKSIKHTQW